MLQPHRSKQLKTLYFNGFYKLILSSSKFFLRVADIFSAISKICRKKGAFFGIKFHNRNYNFSKLPKI